MRPRPVHRPAVPQRPEGGHLHGGGARAHPAGPPGLRRIAAALDVRERAVPRTSPTRRYAAWGSCGRASRRRWPRSRHDPAVIAGRMRAEVFTWLVPEGMLRVRRRLDSPCANPDRRGRDDHPPRPARAARAGRVRGLRGGEGRGGGGRARALRAARPRGARREDAAPRRDRGGAADPRRAADPDRDADRLRPGRARLAGGRGRASSATS